MAITAQLFCNSGAFAGAGHYIYALPSAISIAADGGVAVGGTVWTIYDLAGTQVATGTMLASATSFNVSSSGSWIGGGTIVPGWYHLVTNDTSTSAAYVLISPHSPSGGASNLWQFAATPSLTYGSGSIPSGPDLSAWAPGFADRDLYQVINLTPAQLLANVQADPYFTTGDGVRPRDVWIASGAQSATSPTPTQWAAVATALVGAGYHAIYEIPTNEPEFAGMTASQIATNCNAAQAAIIAVDPQARFAVFCSAGFGETSFANWAAVLTLLNFVPDFGSTHMENSNENIPDVVALRQYFNGLLSTGITHWLFTETGMTEAGWGVFQPRRGPRQRCLFRLVAELYGWPKEHCYDFSIFDHIGSGLGTYQVERVSTFGGNIRPGLYALHVMAEALYKTSVPPAPLSFGAAGSLGDSDFIGAHYSGTVNDVVVLTGNGVVGATVTLVSDLQPGDFVTYWDGMGVATTVAVSAMRTVPIPVNDLLTYAFFPPNSIISIVDTDQSVIEFNSATNVIHGATTKNGTGTTIGIVNNDSFSESYTDVTGSSPPYQDTTVPDTFTTSSLTQKVNGFALRATTSGFNGNMASPTAFSVKINGTTVFSYSNPTAVNYANRPSGDGPDGDNPATSTEYWDGAWSWVQKIAPVTITGDVVLTVTATSNGGTILPSSSGDQQINISEWELYKTVTTSAIYEIQQSLSILAGQTVPPYLEAQQAANVYAGTTHLELVDALNHKAGVKGQDFDQVCNTLNGTKTMNAQDALSQLAGGGHTEAL